MEHNEGERHILSHNRVGNKNVVVFAPAVTMLVGFFLVIMAVGMISWGITDRHGFFLFMANFFKYSMYALIVLPVLAALVLIVVCIVKYVVIPLREKERVYAYNDNFMATTKGMKVHHHQDTKLSYNIKQVEGSAEPPQLPAPEVHRPTQEFAIGQLRENGLNVCLGVSKETGEPFVLDLIDGTHYKFIGASGKGKSCLAGSVLDQVTTVNSPEPGGRSARCGTQNKQAVREPAARDIVYRWPQDH